MCRAQAGHENGRPGAWVYLAGQSARWGWEKVGVTGGSGMEHRGSWRGLHFQRVYNYRYWAEGCVSICVHTMLQKAAVGMSTEKNFMRIYVTWSS